MLKPADIEEAENSDADENSPRVGLMISPHLRICLIGDLSEPTDEGMKKVAHKFALTLSRNHEVLPLHVKSVFLPGFWLRLREFRPEIIFYVGGPSLISFIIARAACIYCALTVGKRPKVVIFALHPLLPFVLEHASTLIQPDLILVQSYHSEKRFRKLRLRTRFLPVGVDTGEFTPVPLFEKTRLRQKYGISQNEFVVLHVGSVRKNRGLEILIRVQKNEGNRVLVIGSTSMPMDNSVRLELIASGCLVWRRHFKEIEELYQLADLYVFPVVDKLGSVELPLSVIEAMACNLPVVLTKFGALPRILEEKEGLVFVNEIDDVPTRIEQIKNEDLIIRTREKITPYSWENVTQSLIECFYQVVEEQTR